MLRTVHRPLQLPRPEVDERAARRALREQIGRLEHELGATLASAPPGGPAPDVRVRSVAGPRLLSLGELELLRDDLSERVGAARAALAATAEVHEANRRLIERMMLEPAAYKWVRVARTDIGERGCGHWHVKPRLGLIGMLAGWWHVKLSSGCPLATGRGPEPRPTERSAPPRAPLGAVGAGERGRVLDLDRAVALGV